MFESININSKFTTITNLNSIIIKDIPYDIHSQTKYDLYLNNKSNKTTPLLIIIHGGAWVTGDKSEHHELAFYLCEKKNINVSLINYRTSLKLYGNEIMYPIQLIDCFNALKHLKFQLKNDFNINNIFLMGHSVGAQLATSLIFNFNIIKEANLFKQNNLSLEEIINEIKSIKGLFLTQGIYNIQQFSLNEEYNKLFILPTFGKKTQQELIQLSPININININKFPFINWKIFNLKFFLIYSIQDELVTLNQSTEFLNQLIQNNFQKVNLLKENFGKHDEVPNNKLVWKHLIDFINKANN